MGIARQYRDCLIIMNHNITIPESSAQEECETNFKTQQCKLCIKSEQEQCPCVGVQKGFVPSNPAGIIFRGLLANNPNNPGISIKQGAVSFSEIEGVPLAEVGKVKLCLRNEFMLINTLQVYRAQGNSKPVCFGVDSLEGSYWLLAVIQAKLALSFQINIGNERPEPDTVTGTLFKRSMFGKWKLHRASCATLLSNRHVRLSDEYTSLGPTSEVWTRFQRVEVDGIECLVVKLWGAVGKKELAVPLGQLALWVRALCTLLT